MSLVTASVHLVLENLNLYLEAKTTNTTFFHYSVASCNARQGWIPKQEDLLDKLIEEDD